MRNKNILSIIVIILFSFLGIIVSIKNDYVFGSIYDWFKQSVSFYEYFRNLFYETGDLFPDLALHIGGGQNIYYLAYYGLLSPMLLLSYLFPFVSSGNFIMFCEISLMIFTTILFYYFLLSNGYNRKISLFLSLLLLFSGPMLSMSLKHIMFVQYMPFVIMGLFGVKMYLDKNKSFLLVLSVILIITTSYYFSIPSIICLCLYALYYYIKINNDSIKFKKIFNVGLKCVLRILLGIIISAFLMLPVIYTVFNGRDTINHTIDWLDFIPQIQMKYLMYGSFGIGLTSIVWFSIIYNLLYMKKENKLLCIILLITISFPIINVMLNGYIYLNGKIFIPFIPLFIILIGEMLSDIKNINKNRMFWFLILSLILSLVLFRFDNFIFFICYMADFVCTFILLLFYSKNGKKIIIISILFLSFSISIFNVYRDSLMTHDEFDSIYNMMNVSVADIININVDSIYRFHDNENSQLLNYSDGVSLYKTSIYSSTINNNYSKVFQNSFANNIRHPIAFYIYQDRNVFFQRFMGVRYLLTKKDAPYGYHMIGEYNSGNLYENENVYSLGFSLANLLNKDEYNKLSYIEKLLAYQNNIIIDGESNHSDLDFNYDRIVLDYKITKNNSVIVNKKDSHYMINSEENGKLVLLLNESIKNKTLIISFNVNNDSLCDESLSNDGNLAISINGVKNVLTCVPSFYDNNNKTFDYVISSNEPISKLNISFYEGYYDISDIEVYTVDNSFFDENNTTPLVIDFDKTKGDHIYGSINVSESGYFIFTIPYDKGYTVYVDGKKVEIEKVNGGFIGFKIEPGEHNIHLTFEAPYAKLGRLISLIGIIILTVLVIFERKNKKKDN